MKRYRLLPLAREDLRSIAAYIAQHRPQAAKRMVRRIKDACENTISRFPECGTQVDELMPGMRCFSVESFVIFFRGRNPVDIMRIVHGSRDFNELTFH